MKIVKSIFYSLYIIYFLICGFIGLFYNDIVLRWKWDHIDTWVGLLILVLQLGGVGIVLFLALFVTEKTSIYQLNKIVASKDLEIKALKAKLNDKSVAVDDAISNDSSSKK